MLKEKAARFIIKNKIKRDVFVPQSFSNIMAEMVNFLLLMPENDEDFNNSGIVLNYLVDMHKEISLLTKDFRVSKLPINLRRNAIEYGIKDINKIDLPSKDFIVKLNKKQFDVIIDLNRTEQLFFSYVAYSVNSKFRIGFRKSFADSIYNLQVANNETNSKISYKNLLNCLQML